MKCLQGSRFVFPLLLGLALCTSAQSQPGGEFVPVSDEALLNPDDADWPQWRRTHDSWNFSPLGEIHTENIGEVQLAWSRMMHPGRLEAMPLVYDGVMFLAHPRDIIQALDGATGDLLWEYRRELPEDIGGGFGEVTRNIALYGDKIIHATQDSYLIALDARTGELLWETQAGDYRAGESHSSGPIVVNGIAISGRACGRTRCFIAGHNVETGEELWRTFTTAAPGEPGGDTWGDLPLEERIHVSPWMPGSYDAELNLTYWGTGVPRPYASWLRGTGDAALLYTNSTLALDPQSGEIVWHYQHLPGDDWDMDHPYERLVIDVAVAPNPDEVEWLNPNLTPGEERKVLVHAGKTAIVYVLDAATGEFLWAKPTAVQDMVESIDGETGAVAINPDARVRPDEIVSACPRAAKNWEGSTYSPASGLYYIPLRQTCAEYRAVENSIDGVTWTSTFSPEANGNLGRIDAVSVQTGETVWSYTQVADTWSLLATAGDLLFMGDMDRRFKALDANTGEVLKEFILSSRVTGYPISYAVDGKQYVAVAVGGGTIMDINTTLLTPQVQSPVGGNTVFVFSLPD